MSDEPSLARFGKPIKSRVDAGTQLEVEVIPKRGETIYAVKDSDGDLRFPRATLQFGEDFDPAVRRILREDMKAPVDRFYLATCRSRVHKDAFWTLRFVFVAEIDEPKAKKGRKLEEFTESTLPAGLVGWTKQLFRDVLEH